MVDKSTIRKMDLEYRLAHGNTYLPTSFLCMFHVEWTKICKQLKGGKKNVKRNRHFTPQH